MAAESRYWVATESLYWVATESLYWVATESLYGVSCCAGALVGEPSCRAGHGGSRDATGGRARAR